MLRTINSSSKRWQVWLNQAYFDLQAAELSMDNNFYEWATFQSEQCVEKALKAVIVEGGFRPPKVHKIAVLLSMSNRVNKSFKHVEFQFRTIEAFTFISRYPFLIPGEHQSPHEYVTYMDAVSCINEAKDTFWKIKNLLYQYDTQDHNIQNTISKRTNRRSS